MVRFFKEISSMERKHCAVTDVHCNCYSEALCSMVIYLASFSVKSYVLPRLDVCFEDLDCYGSSLEILVNFTVIP